jgi:hypothetical protein
MLSVKVFFVWRLDMSKSKYVMLPPEYVTSSVEAGNPAKRFCVVAIKKDRQHNFRVWHRTIEEARESLQWLLKNKEHPSSLYVIMEVQEITYMPGEKRRKIAQMEDLQAYKAKQEENRRTKQTVAITV